MSNHLELNALVTRRREDGFFDIEKDREALIEYLKEVYKDTMKFPSEFDRFQYLIEHDYYEVEVMDFYTNDSIGKMWNTLSNKFHEIYGQDGLEAWANYFESYMGAKMFYTQYALQTNDKTKYIENPVQKAFIVALWLAQGDKSLVEHLTTEMIMKRYTPATPTLQNAGRARGGEMVSCFLLNVADSLNSFMYNLTTSAHLSKLGGGVAMNLSDVRARKSSIKGIEGVASGVVPMMKLMEDNFSAWNQLGQRNGSGVANLNVFHADIIEFLATKKIAGDEKSRMQTLSIGLLIPDLYMELVKANEPMYVFDPYSVNLVTGQEFSAIKWTRKLYADLIANPDVDSRLLPMSARELFLDIQKTRFESGYPYHVFIDNANNSHLLNRVGHIKQSNLCTEIFQLQETSEIRDYPYQNDYKRDVQCNLGSINILRTMQDSTIEATVRTAIRALTAVSRLSEIPNAPTINKANEELNAIGLGFMNLHGYLANNGIGYESEEAKDFANVFFAMCRYYAIKESCELSKQYGAFKGFIKSDYANSKAFEQYLEKDHFPTTPKVKELFEAIDIPTNDDWLDLATAVARDGIHNAYLLAIAPTASISYVTNATQGVMPITEMIVTRTKGDMTTYYPMPNLNPSTQWYYKSAFDMQQNKIIDLIAVIQKHICQGISADLFIKQNESTANLAKYTAYAHSKGLKSLYYTRVKNMTVEECLSCSV